MTPDRWERIKELFAAAVTPNGSERAVFLAQACQTDEAMRMEVERLLAGHDPADSFLEDRARAFAIAGSAGLSEPGERIGTHIGRYSIHGLIGKGGMGAVYRAVREDDFRMEVAIKLLTPGTDTEAALGRFRVERQILAGLQH